MDIVIFFIVLGVFVCVFTLEVIAPASNNDCDRRWLILASSLSLFQTASTLIAGWFFTAKIQEISIFNFGESNVLLQGCLGFLLTGFVAYWWHRAMHKSDFLWRTFHQLHHSPRRIESLTAFYLHPFDAVAATILNGICCYTILGLNAYGCAISLLAAAIYNIFIHADLKTPYWLGYVIQRPEMHRVHHKHMSHQQNYGLAFFDIIFGTFENPKEYVSEVGFDVSREKKVYDMLLTKDVYKKET